MSTSNQLLDDLPPHYTDFSQLPPTFRVGSENVSPLVTITEAQAHLRLLAAFAKLKKDVRDAHIPSKGSSEDQDRLYPQDPDRAWVVFVNRAVFRFDKFMSGKWTADFPQWSEEAIPPLDVVMVWHTYLLNPLVYYEDSARRTTPFARRLAAMESMPLTLIASLVDPTTLDPVLPSSQREAFFETTAELPFMYNIKTTFDDVLTLTCPCCNTVNPTVLWITPTGETPGKGHGFAEPEFQHECDWCKRKFTRSMMGVRKFCEEFTRRRAQRKVFFAETLLQPLTGKPDEMLGEMLMLRMVRRINAVNKLKGPCPQDEITQQSINLAKSLDWSSTELLVQIHQGLRPRQTYRVYEEPLPRVKRLVTAYSLPGYASLDLVSAVLRQESFITKLQELGWLEVDRFKTAAEQTTLLRAIARYHAFLDLMASKSDTFSLLVPTLDIDLAWHTHQLSATAYRADTLRLVKRIPNHDDAIESNNLHAAYDNTAAAWKARFGVAYSVCGCMPDLPTASKTKATQADSKSSGGQIEKPSKSGILKLFKSKGKAVATASSPRTSTVSNGSTLNPDLAKDLVSLDMDQADSSHPSEHNLRLLAPDGIRIDRDLVSRELASKERMALIKKDLERAESRVSNEIVTKEEKESVDDWRKLQAERKELSTEHKEAFTIRQGANGAYFPYWGVSVEPSPGFFGAMKYKDVPGGCASGCAACGSAEGRFIASCGAIGGG